MLKINANIDLTITDPWHVPHIVNELVEGFDKLAHLPPSVAILGSSRAKPEEAVYLAAVETARLLAQAGFGIITGGGPGIMEAANKGAQEGGNTSIGCNIELPYGRKAESLPRYLTWVSLLFCTENDVYPIRQGIYRLPRRLWHHG